jgi:hypothetical protein
MLKRLKRTLTKLATPRKERIDGSRVRCLLERLEERAMLSASYGSLPHSYGGAGVGRSAGSDFRPNDSAAFASASNHSTGYATSFGAMRDRGGVGPMYGDVRAQSQLRDSVGQRWSSEQMYRQYSAGPPATWTMAEPVHPTYIVTTYWVYTAPPVKLQPAIQPDPYADPWLDDGGFVPERMAATAGATNGLGIGARDAGADRGIDLGHLPDGPLFNQLNLKNSGTSVNQLYVRSPGPSEVFALARSLTDSSASLPASSHESSTASVLTAVARDLAFQEYSPMGLSVIASNSYDRVSLSAIGSESTASGLLDGFIGPTDLVKADDIVASSDAVARERQAVDAVLQSLNDIDTLVPASASTDVKIQIDLQTDAAVDELTSSEFDGGMVLIQSAGSSDDGGFDLTPIYADHLERFDAPAKMETSVGLFQAVEVAVDEIPVADVAQPSTPAFEMQREIKVDENLPMKREQPASNKAASVVGAATLTGAIVWMNSSKRSRIDRAAQKRGVGRS